MFTIFGKPYRHCDDITRQHFLTARALGMGGLALADVSVGAEASANVWYRAERGDISGQRCDVPLGYAPGLNRLGWTHTFIYQMRDNEGGPANIWGIFHADSTPKNAATDIHNLTTILADNTSNAPGSLDYSIPNEPATVHDMLMQKSDGTFYLAVWDERVVGTGSDNVTVNLGGAQSVVDVYDPTVGTSVQQQLNNVSSVTLSLSDHPLILAIPQTAGPSVISSTPAGDTFGVVNDVRVTFDEWKIEEATDEERRQLRAAGFRLD